MNSENSYYSQDNVQDVSSLIKQRDGDVFSIDDVNPSKVIQREALRQELAGLGIRGPMFQTICEYGNFNCNDVNAADLANAAMNVIDNEIDNLSSQIEMLQYQRNALEKKKEAVIKVACDMAGVCEVRAA